MRFKIFVATWLRKYCYNEIGNQKKDNIMATKLQYISHSAFYIKTGDFGILVDPFISGNPKAEFDVKKEKITDIFVTHGHADHLGDAIPVSRGTQAVITAIFELANYCMEKGAFAKGVNFGGKLEYPWGSAVFLPAFHSSSTPDGRYAGMPASILFDINGTKIYHAGDTCLNSEMKVCAEVYKPDIALLPVGSFYTMDADSAVTAAKWLGVKKVVPMHYNTFDAISTDIDLFAKKLEQNNIEPIILKPSESIEL